MTYCFAALYWNPSPDLLTIGGHPIAWYGILFAFGFMIAFFVGRAILREKIATLPLAFCEVRDWELLRQQISTHQESHEAILAAANKQFLSQGSQENKSLREKWAKEGIVFPVRSTAYSLADFFIGWIVVGAVVGARLGEVFFYNWSYYSKHPWDIFKVWQGGLASHGGAVGVLIALVCACWIIRKKYPALTVLVLLDVSVIPTAFVGCCIRFGNFINQEILGTPTDLPWGVIFGSTIAGEAGIALHPVQLYESIFYLLTFGALYCLWRYKNGDVRPGYYSGWFFVLVFGFRFIVEWWKLPQSRVIDETTLLNMGQYLSLPFILLGFVLLLRSTFWAKSNARYLHKGIEGKA